MPPRDAPAGAGPPSPDTITIELLRLAKVGDAHALARIMERYLPRLQRWASGRLPAYARSAVDTADLVQDTLMRTLEGFDRIEVRGPGGFQAYVRQAVLNRLRNQIRWAGLRRGSEEVSDQWVDPAPSPLENAIGSELLDAYERGMAALGEDDRQLLHMRIELDYDYVEIAAMTGRTTGDAARMAFQRALRRLAEAMGHER